MREIIKELQHRYDDIIYLLGRKDWASEKTDYHRRLRREMKKESKELEEAITVLNNHVNEKGKKRRSKQNG